MNKKKWINIVSIYSIIYTLTTLLNSVLYLSNEIYEDPSGNWHELDRAIILLIGIVTFQLCTDLPVKPLILRYVIAYVPSQLLAFLYVWFSGFMKRVYIICLFLVGFLGIGVYLYSYQYFVQEGGEESGTTEVTQISTTLPDTVEAVARKEERITRDTLYYMETYRIDQNTTIREAKRLPVEVIGSNRKQFAEYLEKMMEDALSEEKKNGFLSIELIDFSDQAVVVRKTYKEPARECAFYLDVQMGRVIVRNSLDDSLYAYTEIKFDTLPENLKREILRGYPVENLEVLYEFLESYSS